ncbi:MAG: HD domain-containing protein [Oscillospiraceae bacterium]|nr:HD domain-containing protein [Oscillospiraceae bacterium]
MFTDSEFSIFDFASCISESIDLVSPALNNHHKKVAYLSYAISMEMGLPDDDIRDIVLAAILHDIGAFTASERLKIVSEEFKDSGCDSHAEMGYRLLKGFEPLSRAAEIIRYHHTPYDPTSDIPTGSYILHLADRVSVVLNDKKEVLEQISGIMEKINKSKGTFHPGTLEALERLASIEYIWIETCSLSMSNVLAGKMSSTKKVIHLDTLKGFAKVVANFIDCRSRFTSTHSSGVAAVAEVLTRLSGFSERECRLMEIAGFLHDLGKLAVSNDILEKNAALNDEELNEMRKHTYYTRVILGRIRGLENIADWAAFHHEKLNGNGYPFHVKGDDIPKLARIMAVADIFTAITEDRPYREGMNAESALKVLDNMVANGSIDQQIVALVRENFPLVNDVRIAAQRNALEEFSDFHG